MQISRKALIALVVLAAGCSAADDPSSSDATASPERLTEVADRGAQVMPFDLDATTHRFEATAEGGVQVVVANDSGDDEQVRLIREHLSHEAAQFRQGHFDDPAGIHGHDMPGLEALAVGHADITVTYDEVEGGARITYTTDVPELQQAIHEWFAAQMHDHGDHAEAG